MLIEGVGGLRILQDVGAKVHALKGLKLHGKMLLADGKRAIIGSINLAPGSFDARRELAIVTEDPAVIRRLQETVEGLSVAAVTYYVVGLIGYAAKGVKASGRGIDPEMAMGISIPLVVAVVAWGLRRTRRRLAAKGD